MHVTITAYQWCLSPCVLIFHTLEDWCKAFPLSPLTCQAPSFFGRLRDARGAAGVVLWAPAEGQAGDGEAAGEGRQRATWRHARILAGAPIPSVTAAQREAPHRRQQPFCSPAED